MQSNMAAVIKGREDFIPKIELISIDLLEPNEGQLSQIDEETNKQVGIPRNPRWIRDTRYEALKKSITDDPEYLLYHPLEVYTLSHIKGKDGKYIVLGGNQRLAACKELGFKEIPSIVFLPDTPTAKLRAYVIKSNLEYGQNDWDLLSSEWETEELSGWGMELDYIAPNGEDVNIDDLFEDAATSTDKDKGQEGETDELMIQIRVSEEYRDNIEDIKEALRVTLEEWEGCEIK